MQTHNVIFREFKPMIEITAEEAATAFAYGDTHYQAAFLNELGRLTSMAVDEREYPGLAWWEFQCHSLVHDDGVASVSDAARAAIMSLEDELTARHNAEFSGE